MTYALAVLGVWCLAPYLVTHAMTDAPYVVRLRCMAGMIVPMLKILCVLPVSLSAPIVVPFALLFTKWEDNELPRWARWYDNDVSINGDKPWYWDPAYTGWAYYAQAHPRSFWARYVWLGWRNRASRLALDMGHRYEEGEYADAEHWGDPLTNRNHEGHVINRRGPLWQAYLVKRISKGLCIRINCGYKVWSNDGDGRPVAMPVFVGFSILNWTGEQ